MPAPQNRFKQRLRDGELQIGLWLGLGSAHVAELAATTGFDWLVIDAEHGPSDIPLIVDQLRSLDVHRAGAVVRLPMDQAWLIKQALDVGVQTLLVPMVETVEQAKKIVAATRYPPHGLRGVGAALARASRYGSIGDYIRTADEQICTLVQVETLAGVAVIEELAAVDGVDGIFVGPSDLAADMGLAGRATEPPVVEAVVNAIRAIVATGCPAGLLSSDPVTIRAALDQGATFVAVGTDVGVLSGGLQMLLQRYRE